MAMIILFYLEASNNTRLVGVFGSLALVQCFLSYPFLHVARSSNVWSLALLAAAQSIWFNPGRRGCLEVCQMTFRVNAIVF